MTFQLPDLPYATDAFEPHIDQQTMEIHHGKHHAGYVNKLNKALESEASLLEKSLPELLSNDCEIVPENIRTAVRNNGGGHANHTLFWTSMSPDPKSSPEGELHTRIQDRFGNLETFKQEFSQAGMNRFGSGWAWLIIGPDEKLQILSTPNQDSPLMSGQTPLIGLDVWEHAYYLKYQNRRADYISAWWNVLDWSSVEQRFKSSRSWELDPAGILVSR